LPGVGAWLATWWAGLLGGGMALWLSWLVATRAPSERPLAAISITLFAVAYAGALPSFLLWIRHAHNGNGSWAGTAMVFFPLVIVWVCDSAAMFGGKAIGGPKLAPTISPGKTRSGAISGLVGGVATALVLA